MMLSMQIILFSVVPLALANLDENSAKILQMHNEFRQQILECKVKGQPSAKRMPPLAWDDELASLAEELAKSCTFANKIPESKRFKPVGQNIASCGSVEDVIKRWFGQHISYNFKDHRCTHRCRQYMQMVFENTTHIGCAVNECPYATKYTLFIVCNYGPGATFVNRPYEAKKINEVCPVETTKLTVQPEQTYWEPATIISKYNEIKNKNNYNY
uniref:SCP domain-containing protein n=1 Tax=Trichobilharzia regenti TaxID=157069 RepID=A0AA85J391_TRIRE|nr:unnamed protein product [Trichobilharzia regenti]